MKFIGRLGMSLIKFLGISIPLQVIGMVVVGVYLLIRPDARKLPDCLKWFDGADQYLGRDTSVYDKVMSGSAYEKWVWLTLRNPINYFSYKYFGVLLRDPVEHTYYYRSNYYKEIGDHADSSPGLFICEITNYDYKEYYEYYYIFKYPFVNKCFRFRMGWKIGQDLKVEVGHTQEVFVISPWHSFG